MSVKVLFIYPNERHMSTIPPSIALLSQLLKDNGHRVDLFDTTFYEFDDEHTALVKWEPNTQFEPHKHWGGEEILVLEGVFYDEYGVYPKGSWIRSPHLSQHSPFTKEEGAVIFVKTGNLRPNFD